MPRLATLLRPLRSFSSDPITPKSHMPPGELIKCPYCSRVLKCDGDLTRHLTLRAICRREEERAARAQVTSQVDFWSIVEAIGQARIQPEAKTRSGGRSKTESEARLETEVPVVEVCEVDEAEAQAVAEIAVQGPNGLTTRQEATPLGESAPAGHAGPDVEPPSEHVPATNNGASPPPGTPDGVPDLIFDENEGDYVEYYPDPRAGAPINDKTVKPLNLDAYMATAGDLGIPFFFNTAELL